MALRLADGTAWSDVLARAVAATGEAFGAEVDGVTTLHNLVEGEWRATGQPAPVRTPVDNTVVINLRRLDADTARAAVLHAAAEHRTWARTPLADRKARVADALDSLTAHRDLLAMLLVWEIGKPWRLACADVDRALDGVRWYADEIDRMLAGGREPLPGPVSNIASWNYPMSVLVHAELVQLLAGNAVIAKTPSQGGAVCLTVAHALMRRAGLPATLVSGGGEELSEVLVRAPEIGAVAFVGGRSNGGKVAAALLDTDKRHFIEQEGLNAWGIWNFSQWDLLAAHLKKGFEYGKQRCTAYPRFVVQRDLVDEFLDMYLPVVRSVRFGHPLAVGDDWTAGDPLPELDFGPLISAAKADELHRKVDEAVRGGAVPLHRGKLTGAPFLPGQDTSAYVAPSVLLAPPGRSRLMHAEPFGPVDTIVVVDTTDELLAAMNASNGALVASLACDDTDEASKLAVDLQAFKVGINKPRSRGDRDEPFGGRGASWKGAFVGGDLLVQAVTVGGDSRLYGNFPDYNSYPAT
ncbi:MULTISPECIES: aldehyde dehydrogenase family protein [Micromonospora]|uniref:aldehyde dehydrogenase family protein n=1 Tax=Micromonospora TaxID=1873 RepID=UPI001B38BC3A|nr:MULTISPECIES: aldehyde dehydrogenase family protein [Micromonospora]MBQ0980145.1 aldehyde dehydrogenase family protein [Micromonospora sp. M61]MBQ1039425.1 aldehyde dehydrogenase family protein [Micromonospora sp. C81]WSK47287.1 aldehyde dehydrogenase family protein [Micromonospora zamorensis]WTI18825.1 aldehyde dehydrogenase family protein [Micromonospora zamorensis]